jgi:hypothetical protein
MKWAKDNVTWRFILKQTENVKSKRELKSQLMEIFDLF